MANRFQSTRSKVLLDRALANRGDIPLLHEFAAALAERKNNEALKIYLELGKILERAYAEKRRRALNMKREEDVFLPTRTQEGFFEWPVTDAPASRHGFRGDVFSYKEGLLSYVGYSVGTHGQAIRNRRRILDCVFHKELPRVQSAGYMLEWGEPQTSARLEKMADCLASFTRNAARNAGIDCSTAINDWKFDLRYLHDVYYVQRFHFAWPDPTDGRVVM